MEDEIMRKFLSVNKQSNSPRIGKYASKKEKFYEDIEKWQNERTKEKYDIRPIQFTFEITNRCNCNCKDCGMSANSITEGKKKLTENDIYKLVDDLYENGVPAFAITGGEPFLEFDNMCKMIKYSDGKVDVNKIASYFSGGGHVRAAGCTMQGSIYDVMNNLLEQIEKEIKEKMQ